MIRGPSQLAQDAFVERCKKQKNTFETVHYDGISSKVTRKIASNDRNYFQRNYLIAIEKLDATDNFKAQKLKLEQRQKKLVQVSGLPNDLINLVMSYSKKLICTFEIRCGNYPFVAYSQDIYELPFASFPIDPIPFLFIDNPLFHIRVCNFNKKEKDVGYEKEKDFLLTLQLITPERNLYDDLKKGSIFVEGYQIVVMNGLLIPIQESNIFKSS
jgi:hypothetical protein